MLTATKIKLNLKSYADPEKADFFPRFFKTGKGEYGEGDRFFGVTVPNQRKVAKQFKHATQEVITALLYDSIHECRLTSLFILVEQFSKANDKRRGEIYRFYLKHRRQINNWDLVDSSAHKIVGAFLMNRPRTKLYQLARSKHLWSQRISIVATYQFIRQNDFEDTLAISGLLIEHEHDLIHKAVGWMLRETGKRDVAILKTFLTKHYHSMPRTMLRYAIERFDQPTRSLYLKGEI
jgi:3-methyladenine DNA glycosylase AlkD